jgi:FkbM family methyltransferase
VQLVDGWYITSEDVAKNHHPVRYQSAKDIRVIDVALKHIVGRDCVIQAGARVGLWPKTLAQHFRKVVAFEPEGRNFECAKANLADCDNVELHKAALSKAQGRGWLAFSEEQTGSHWMAVGPGVAMIPEGESCDTVAIDDLNLSPDAIFLDIEGWELVALGGAQKTIDACKPVLVLEENSARKRYGFEKGALASRLKPYGYVVADRVGKDLIFVCVE